MEKIKIKQPKVQSILDVSFYKHCSYEKFITMLDQELFKKCDAKYDDVKRIVDEAVRLIVERSYESLRFNDKQINDYVYLLEYQIKQYMFIWKGLSDDPVPFKEGHTYNTKFNLGFGDHIFEGGYDGKIIKQRPSKLFFYLENGIVGHYDIKFYNGIEFSFDILEDGTLDNTRAWLDKTNLTDISIIPTFVLLRTFFSLGLKPTENKEVYKLIRNVMKEAYKVIKGVK